MIQQAKLSEVKSRNECNIYNNGFLPLITAPMYSVVNNDNYKKFIDNKINVCLPRTTFINKYELNQYNENIFISMSLYEFIEQFLEENF